MHINCLSCGKKLKLSSNIIQSINNLAPGKSFKIKCPGCDAPVNIDRSILQEKRQAPIGGSTAKVSSVKPPGPPDISWLKEGLFDEEQVIEDVPLALVVMKPSESFETIVEAIEGIGYKTEIVKDTESGIEKMQFTEYSAVVLDSAFEGGGIHNSVFHQYMSKMAMAKRRFVFYILVGKEFQTMYNLQALAYSANLVVSETEIPFFNTIIRKAIPEYEELFGPIMEELQLYGK